MADSREIAHEYAKGGIRGIALINGGAAVAVLSQLNPLFGLGVGTEATVAILLWAVGVATAAATWLVAFLSTRYVDRADRSETETARQAEIRNSNRYMRAGLTLMAFGIALFVIGAIIIVSAAIAL